MKPSVGSSAKMGKEPDFFKAERTTALRTSRLFSMRAWFAIIFLALLPFQFTWAAVAPYCGHEGGQHAQHLGHHAHQHLEDAHVDQGSSDVSGTTLGSTDLDCGHCHGICCGMPCAVFGLTPQAIASRPVTLAQGTVRTLTHSPPERPQWAPLA